MSLEDNINEYLKQYAVVKEIKEKLDGQDKEIERLTNIIKKVREYIENSKVRKPWVKGSYILKILDKGE